MVPEEERVYSHAPGGGGRKGSPWLPPRSGGFYVMCAPGSGSTDRFLDASSQPSAGGGVQEEPGSHRGGDEGQNSAGEEKPEKPQKAARPTRSRDCRTQRRPRLTSPAVTSDGTVTFLLYAPRAQAVPGRDGKPRHDEWRDFPQGVVSMHWATWRSSWCSSFEWSRSDSSV